MKFASNPDQLTRKDLALGIILNRYFTKNRFGVTEINGKGLQINIA